MASVDTNTDLEVGTGTGTGAGPPSIDDVIRGRILHVLSVYPRISHTMLQVGIGTGTPSAFWGPILQDLIEEGRVVKETICRHNPVTGRDQSYHIISLAPPTTPRLRPLHEDFKMQFTSDVGEDEEAL